jgi:Tfp pilus assembly protein PilV
MSRGRQLRGEDGFGLLEVIFSAFLLAVMIVAVFKTFDVTSQVSGEEKARAIAASLAESDQERLRALPVADLSAMADRGAASSTKLVDGVSYTVSSNADWIADATQSKDCTSNGAAADYVKIVSTVSPPATVGIKPVKVTSVVTPPVGTFGAGQGSLAVAVVNAAGVGVQGIAVTLTGPGTPSTRTTDSSGCAFFGYQPTGSYTAGVSFLNWVDPDGNPSPQKAENISPEGMSTDTFKYDLGKSLTAQFVTEKLDASGNLPTTTNPSDFVASNSRYVTFSNGGMGADREFGDGSYAASIDGTKLFPFTDKYAIFAGDCPGARPANAAAVGSRPEVPANQFAGGAATVLVPAISMTVQRSTTDTTKVAGAKIRLTPTSAGCAGTFTLGGATATTQANGRVADPGAPFGSYNYCVEGDRGDGIKRTAVGTVNNTNPAGIKTPNVALGNTGTCP